MKKILLMFACLGVLACNDSTYEESIPTIDTPQNEKKPEIHGGFAVANYDGSEEVEDMLRKDLKVTVRCIPLEGSEPDGNCIFTGKPAKYKAIFAKSY